MNELLKLSGWLFLLQGFYLGIIFIIFDLDYTNIYLPDFPFVYFGLSFLYLMFDYLLWHMPRDMLNFYKSI